MMEEVAEGWQSGRGSSSHVAHYLAPDQSKVSVGNAVSGGLQTGTAAAKKPHGLLGNFSGSSVAARLTAQGGFGW